MDKLLSEQKVLKTIDNLKANFTCYDSVTLDEVASHVKAIPSAEPKTGHWIKIPLIEAGQTYSHECSLCGRRILTTNAGLSEFPYCHCGAKMVEPQESEVKE